MSKKYKMIGFYGLTILGMIALIPTIQNDYLLMLLYIVVSGILFSINREKYDYAAYLIGLIGITISEYFFISTGVETFNRISLLGVMPIWLPFLWAYAFVVIKRSLRILA